MLNLDKSSAKARASNHYRDDKTEGLLIVNLLLLLYLSCGKIS